MRRLSILGHLRGYVARTIAEVCCADQVLRNSFPSVFSSSAGFGRMLHCLRLPRSWTELFRKDKHQALKKFEKTGDLAEKGDIGKYMKLAARLRSKAVRVRQHL
jgi:hypothetical protein